MKQWLSVLASLAEVLRKGLVPLGMETVQMVGITGLIVIPESLPEPELNGVMFMGNPTRQVLLR